MKNKKNKNLTLIVFTFIILILGFLLVMAFIIKRNQDNKDPLPNNMDRFTNINNANSSDLKKFASDEDFVNQVKKLFEEQKEEGGDTIDSDMARESSLPSSGLSRKSAEFFDGGGGDDFSQTNVQVQGVDEADIVKTDGKYIYNIRTDYENSSTQSIVISQATPLDEAKVLSTLNFENSQLQEIFIEKNNLMVFGTRYYEAIPPNPMRGKTSTPNSRGISFEEMYMPMRNNLTFVEIYNITDRSNPMLKRKLEFDGTYKTSRKIDNDVYFVLNNYSYYYPYALEADQITAQTCHQIMPQYREGLDISGETEMKALLPCSQVEYIAPITNLQYISVITIPINNYSQPIYKKTILGSGENVYSSTENMYIVQSDYNYLPTKGISGSTTGTENEPREQTRIFKFALNFKSTQYVAFSGQGTVPGRVLNQFSMDEFNDHFRIATTIGNVSRSGKSQSQNNIYVLDKNLTLTGKIENIAPGERIYSARFMGKRGFLVTFKKVDPFFTIDLSDPSKPRLIGQLKIPGYSDYLHPYDENHIIGIGKNTVEASESLRGTANFAWYQGIKMAMFDVTDFANPKEMFKIEIGDRGTNSPILNDHKALLFSQKKNLLVIPVLEAQLSPEQKLENREGNVSGSYVYQGAYVFRVDLKNGFDLRTRITHYEDRSAFQKSGYYFSNQGESVKRSLYIGDNLYTLSDKKIRIHDLTYFEEQGEIDFSATQEVAPTQAYSCQTDSDCKKYISHNNCELYCANNEEINNEVLSGFKVTCDSTLWDPPLERDCRCINSNCKFVD